MVPTIPTTTKNTTLMPFSTSRSSLQIICCCSLHVLLMLLLVIFATSITSVTAAGGVMDPYANTSTPLRETMRNKHSGVTITIQILEFQKEYYMPKFRNFEKLTGATVKEIESTTASWYDDVRDDITNRSPGFIDLYATFGNWVPDFVELGGLQDISEQVGEVGLDWFDIMPAVRLGVASYKQKIYAVPLDGDVIMMLYRTDLVEDVGLPTPRSWDDVFEIMEYYKDKDFNGDGVPDYGNCFSSARNDIAEKIFWAIASSILQLQGTSQGTFFDTKTMEPITASPKFKQVLQLYQKLVLSSAFRDNNAGVPWKDSMADFLDGRCVMFYNYLGPIKAIIGQQAESGLAGKLNVAPLPGLKCMKDNYCPHKGDDGVSHAPFLASGGMSYAVNSRISNEKQKAALDFAFYLSDPAVSFWDVAYSSSFLEPLRRRHTASLGNNETQEAKAFLANGWEDRQLGQLKEVTEFNFLSKNYVLDLRIKGAEAYQERGTMSHVLVFCNGDATVEETANAMTKSWNKVTDRYGLDKQRALYRETLGLPPISGKTELIRNVVIPIVSVLFLVLVGILIMQRHTIKHKTRDVEKAPKTGTVALIFTDVEGSTGLWDSSKSVMSKALDVHHDVIRSCIDRYNAYEVKTIGDSFMIAVGDADRAVKLVNDIQLSLLNADWPVELAELPSTCVNYFPLSRKNRTPRVMFRGLRVRIGVHLGEHSENVEEGGQLQIMYDKVAKGYDYYGPVANAAARIEHIGFGGQTLISSAVCSLLSEEVKRECDLKTVGSMELRGVSEEVFLYQCLPISLGARKFIGLLRRRESNGETLSSDDDEMIIRSIQTTETDLATDVTTLNTEDLRKLAKRLQDQVTASKVQDFRRGSSQTPTSLSGRQRRFSTSRLPNRYSSLIEDKPIREIQIDADADDGEDNDDDCISFGDELDEKMETELAQARHADETKEELASLLLLQDGNLTKDNAMTLNGDDDDLSRD